AAGLVVREIFHAPGLLPGWSPPADRARGDDKADRARGDDKADRARGDDKADRARGDDGAAFVTEVRVDQHPDDSGRRGSSELAGPRGLSEVAAIVTEVRAQEVSARVLAKLSYRAEPEGV